MGVERWKDKANIKQDRIFVLERSGLSWNDSNANEEGEEEEEGNEEEEEEEDCPYRQWRLNRERREYIYVISI